MALRSWHFSAIFFVLSLFARGGPAVAAPSAQFDLTGPRLEVKVTRAGKTLPISQVPNLQAGDRLWLHPDMPDNQSVHYLLIPVFLRGSLNPPPSSWFTKVETWRAGVRKDGVNVQVPAGALQALVFWAPETGGDFSTVRTAVRARPGVFVRAAQDLYAADLTRSRLDSYVDAVKQIAATDPADLEKRAGLLAQTLYLKLNKACFELPAEQQESCLTENTSNVVLNDAQSQSMVTALTSGAASDMINQISSSTAAGGGVYSPYVGAIVDMVRIMGSMHTAQYAYIPALGVMQSDVLAMKLNSPPSFSNPKSVMVASLPPVAGVRFPSLRAVRPQEMLCLERPSLVLSVEGAPLVFSTGYAHDISLRVQDTAGHALDLPATANAERGGFVVDANDLQKVSLVGGVTAELRGDWGFDSYDGPTFVFTNSEPQHWALTPQESHDVTASDKVTLNLLANSVVCVRMVDVITPQGTTVPASWKPNPPKLLAVNLPLNQASHGLYTVQVAQYGQTRPDRVQVHAYAPSATVTGLTLHAGDSDAIILGNRLNEIASVELAGVTFHPSGTANDGAQGKLSLNTAANATSIPALQAGAAVTAHVHLKDGRILDFPAIIAPSRPKVQLINKSVALNSSGAASVIRLGNDDDLPQYGRLTFFLKSILPADFPRDEKIEIAATSGAFDTMLSLTDATLTLQDSQTVLAVLDPAKTFGPSAFGQLRFRAVSAAGVNGDWQPLANLVRLPSLKDVHCPSNPAQQCVLAGDNLFLIGSVADTPEFTRPVAVPLGFAGATMKVPRPNGTTLYLKLRDDPGTVDLMALPVYPESDAD